MLCKKIIPLVTVFAIVFSLPMTTAKAVDPGTIIEGVGAVSTFLEAGMTAYELWHKLNSDSDPSEYTGFNPGGIYGDGVGREELAAAYSTYVSDLESEYSTAYISSDGSLIFLAPHNAAGARVYSGNSDSPFAYCEHGSPHSSDAVFSCDTYSFSVRSTAPYYGMPGVWWDAVPLYAPVAGSYSVYRFECSVSYTLADGRAGSLTPHCSLQGGSGLLAGGIFYLHSGAYVDMSANVVLISGSYGPVYLKCDPAVPVDLPESTTRPTSITGNYGIIGDDGQLTTIGTQTIVNEGSSTYYNPVTSTTYDLSGWTYDYSTRTYDLTLSTGDTVTVEYADESVNITEGDTVYNVYYLVEQEAVDPDECTHDYTCVSTTLPSCTGSGLDTYTCSLCGNTYTQIVAATGHTWEIKQSVTTQYDDTGELITEGYTIYECSTCGEQYKSTDGTSPPSGSGSSSGSTSTGSFWEKVGTLFGTVADGVISMIETMIGKILDALISLVEMLSEKFNAVLDAVLSLFDRVPDLFGGFTSFLAAVFPFLPEEFMDVLLLGLIAFVFAALFRYLTKGK